jgi:hypothetical protein
MEEIKNTAMPALTAEQALAEASKSIEAEFTAEIARAVEEAKALQIAGIDDHEGYKAVNQNRIDLKNGRLKIQKVVTALEDMGKAFTKSAKTKGAEIIEPIQTAEAIQKAKTDAIDQARQAEADRIERERLERFKARTEELMKIGARFDGLAYVLGNAKSTPERIETAMDSEWPEIVAKFINEAEAIAETEKQAKAEKQRLKALEEANARKDAEIAQMRAELEAMRRGANIEAPEAPIHENPIKSEIEKVFKSEAPSKEITVSYPAPIQTPAPIAHEPISAPAPSLQVPAHNPAPIKQTPLSASEQHLQNILGNMVNANAVHFKGGYRSAVAFMKSVVLEAIQDPTIKKRSELVSKIEAL